MLNKIFYILILLIGINFTSFAQSKTTGQSDNVAAKLINFYPNPASSTITFEFLKGYDKSYSLEVYNFMGKKVYEVKRTPARITLNLDDFFRGVYIFQLRDKNAAIVQSGKFQVVK
ncbi:MAG: T9SS type A sorting domain-containing protein [Chitinophagaceae bacterium]|nr:MAG: T9SS type A sorting domain-containing protein [Chitinophagaceae bacterium]